MQILNNKKNIKNINITKTSKLDVVGKSKLQNLYLEILQKKQIIFATGPAGTGKTFLAVAAAVSQLLENKFDRIILSSECGFGHVPLEITRAKLSRLVEAGKKY